MSKNCRFSRPGVRRLDKSLAGALKTSLWFLTMRRLSLILAFLFLGCTTLATGASSYPDDWWREIPASELASWEIPPQAADRKKGEVILSKRTELGVFSNFAATPFEMDGKRYASVEGFWQMMKYPEGKDDPRAQNPEIKWIYTRDQVAQLSDRDAKKAGDLANENMKKMGINWISYQGERFDYKSSGAFLHYGLVYRAIHAKVLQNPTVKELLIKTGDLKLRPDHEQKPDVTPAYKYFEICMRIREGLIGLQK